MNPFEESKKYFNSPIQEFQYFDKYSRWSDDLGRRETWNETVQRTVSFLKKTVQVNSSIDFDKIYDFIVNMKVMPSMRLLAMAGPAVDRNNLCAYNCTALGVDSIKSFSEALLISMCGAGVGFSVENKYIRNLPDLPHNIQKSDEIFCIEDTTEGWVDALYNHIYSLYNGKKIRFDFSDLRPAGSILKVKGGRSSGPNALRDTFDFIYQVFDKSVENKNKKLKPIEIHDIMCSIGNCAVSGGTRRTAMISLFDIDDKEMRNAKIGNYHHYRYNANNSAVWPVEDITQQQYIQLLSDMFCGQAGEPAIASNFSLKNTVPSRRDWTQCTLLNPCGS